jgi:hypothetical protein
MPIPQAVRPESLNLEPNRRTLKNPIDLVEPVYRVLQNVRDVEDAGQLPFIDVGGWLEHDQSPGRACLPRQRHPCWRQSVEKKQRRIADLRHHWLDGLKSHRPVAGQP